MRRDALQGALSKMIKTCAQSIYSNARVKQKDTATSSIIRVTDTVVGAFTTNFKNITTSSATW